MYLLTGIFAALVVVVVSVTFFLGANDGGNKVGAPKSVVWEFFDEVGSKQQGSNRVGAKCKLCDGGRFEVGKAKPCDMRKHILDVCPGATDEQRDKLDAEQVAKHGDGGNVKGQKRKKTEKQTSMTQHFRSKKVEQERARQIDAKILRFFVTSGLAWMQASSDFFVDLICFLAPGYTPPSEYIDSQ